MKAAFLVFVFLGFSPAQAKRLCSVVLEKAVHSKFDEFAAAVMDAGGVLGVYVAKPAEIEALKKRLFEQGLFEAEETQDRLVRHLLGESSTAYRNQINLARDSSEDKDQNIPSTQNENLGKQKFKPKVKFDKFPGVKTPEQYNQVIDIYTSQNIADYIQDVAARSEAESDKQLIRAMRAIEKFKNDDPLTAEDIKAVESLDGEYQRLVKESSQLRLEALVEGPVDSQVFDYMKKHQNKVREQLLLNNEYSRERVALNIPIVDRDTGKIQIKVILIRDYSHYTGLLQEYKRRAERFKELDERLLQHALDYSRLRHIVSSISAIDLESFLNRRITNTEDSAKIWEIKDSFRRRFDHSDPIHPSTSYLRRAKRRMDLISFKTKIKDNWKKGLAYLLPTFGLSFGGMRFWAYSTSTVEDNQDMENAVSIEYWVNKCKKEIEGGDISQGTPLARLKLCFARQQNFRMRHYYKERARKLKENPRYDSTKDLARAISDQKQVIQKTLESAPESLIAEIYLERSFEYSLEDAFNHYRDKLFEMAGTENAAAPVPQKDAKELSQEKLQESVESEMTKLSESLKLLAEKESGRDQSSNILESNVSDLIKRFTVIPGAGGVELKSIQSELDEEISHLKKYQDKMSGLLFQAMALKTTEGIESSEKDLQILIKKLESILGPLQIRLEELQKIRSDNEFSFLKATEKPDEDKAQP